MGKTLKDSQTDYILAKSQLETLEALEAEQERQYIADNGITNSDGTVPTRIYRIDDDTVFEKANRESAIITVQSGLGAELIKTRKLLEKAENRLIHHYMNCFPLNKVRMLKRAIEKDPDFRQKIIARALLLK